MAQGMRTDALAAHGGHGFGGARRGPRDESVYAVAGDRTAVDIEEDRRFPGAVEPRFEQLAQHLGGAGPQRAGADLAALAVEAHGAGVGSKIDHGDPGGLGGARTGVVEEQQQRVVAPALGTGPVGNAEHGVDFVLVEVCHGRRRGTARRNGLDGRRVLDEFRSLPGDEPVQRVPPNADAVRFLTDHERLYVMDEALTYEPGPEDSVAAHARARGVDPREVMMDTLADGRPLLVLFGRYEGDLEGQRQVIEHPQSVFGLSAGGAHCGALVDASVPTYMLSYFTRDRQRGPRMPLEFVVHKLTQDSASVYGLKDRGVIAPGYKADFNLIDYDGLRLAPLEMTYDLPAGDKRLVQKAQGYRMTISSGEVTYENGEATGAMPGRLIRGAKAAPNGVA